MITLWKNTSDVKEIKQDITTKGRNPDINALNEMTGKKCTKISTEVLYE